MHDESSSGTVEICNDEQVKSRILLVKRDVT